MAQPRVDVVYFLQSVLEEITIHIANDPPESGGLLMGPPDKDIITFFKFDSWGTRSGASYTPQSDVLSNIAEQEYQRNGVIIKGVVHSHPGGMFSLSEGDRATIRRYFESNLGMPYFIGPIVCRWGQSSDRVNYGQGSYPSDSARNFYSLQGKYCNVMAVHIIHRDEIDQVGILSKTVPATIVTSVREVPPSSRPFVQEQAIKEKTSVESSLRKSSVQGRKLFLGERSLKHRLQKKTVENYKEAVLTIEGTPINSIQFDLRQDGVQVIALLPAEFPILGPHICLFLEKRGKEESLDFPLEWNIEYKKSPQQQFCENLKKALEEKLCHD
ncbi:MAG: Mov34/MPN/PAD-1 family protein [Phormidium sp.]